MGGLVKNLSMSFSISALSPHTKLQNEDMPMRILKSAICKLFFIFDKYLQFPILNMVLDQKKEIF